jgi:predicted GNAT family N-acyltransferase
MTILTKRISSIEEMQKCFEIRKKVFIEGQNVPVNEEIDGKDGQSDHYLLYVAEVAVGTARVRYVDDIAKVERVAILDEYQGKGLGKKIMEAILLDVKECNRVASVKLSAQVYAIPFYEKLGFSLCSDEYIDAGIPHKDMRLVF